MHSGKGPVVTVGLSAPVWYDYAVTRGDES